ncbi:MAG: hypothetical protein HY829_11965 [Actinobacteria bacterium]|nr:hypothetical protein [Actinomycetota bacterium]
MKYSRSPRAISGSPIALSLIGQGWASLTPLNGAPGRHAAHELGRLQLGSGQPAPVKVEA